MFEGKRIWRSRDNAIIAGVCEGMGNYFEVDPVVIRILWVIFAFAGGGGIFAYLVCWLIIPQEPIGGNME